jgi:hypothetical protein
MRGTTTQNLMNYIKLKISKKDAMRVSSVVAEVTSSILRPSRMEAFPPSPTKQIRKQGKIDGGINAYSS